ncbi:MAG: hypothetical protein GY866_39505 [Proteobacteria bacterium]|nr:hypothetical protein [Pseudomonadota bacterium]
MKASFTTSDITPEVGFPMGGYMMRNDVSRGILDPIRARLLYLEESGNAVLLVSLDWVHLWGQWTTSTGDILAGSLDMPRENIIFSAIHTHSGPGVFKSVLKPAATENSYLHEVSQKLVRAAEGLPEKAIAIATHVGKTMVANLGANRNDPKSPCDSELVSIVFTESSHPSAVSEEVLFRIVNYGCHPTTLGPENLLFSADWVGEGLDRTAGGFFINGGAGDVSTRFTRKGRGDAERDRFADVFAAAVSEAEAGASPLVNGRFFLTTEKVAVKYRDFPDENTAEKLVTSVWQKIAEAKQSEIDPGTIRQLESVAEGALAQLFLVQSGGPEAVFGSREMEARLSLLTIGNVGILFMPGEVMSRTVISLKKTARQRNMTLLVSGYSGDYFGYLVPGRENVGPKATVNYESLIALLSEESIQGIIDLAKDLIQRRLK